MIKRIPLERDWSDIVVDQSRLKARDIDPRRPWALVSPPSQQMVREYAHFAELSDEWRQFVGVLHMSGAQIVCGQSNANLPDCVYVGDIARKYGNVVVIGAMDSPSRKREAEELATILRPWLGPDKLKSIAEVDPRAKLQHGDSVVSDDTVFLGISRHTDERGARALAEILKPEGLRVQPLAFDAREITHLSTAAAELPNGAVLANPDWVDTEVFVNAGRWVIDTPRSEPRAAGLFWARTREPLLFVPDHFSETIEMLDSLDFQVSPCKLQRFFDYEAVAGALCLFFATPR